MQKVMVRCPGRLSNGVVILVGLDAQAGIIRLTNEGPEALAVGGLGATGQILQPDLFLRPGQTAERFVPPPGTVKLIVVGANNATGSATLEFDVPWWS